MTKTQAASVTIDAILNQFFIAYKPTAAGAVRERIGRVRADLEAHLEAEGARILTSGQIAILEVEKQSGGPGAFVRTMHADDLFYSLDHYLTPPHGLIDPRDRECQIEIVEHLADWLWRHRLVDYTTVSDCTVIELDIALANAHRSLMASEGRDAFGNRRSELPER